MKKTTRILALCIALVFVCLSATGCNAIEEMRERHGFYTKTGSIVIDDTEYLLLPKNKYFSPLRDNADQIYVTDKDVPVLLSAMLGDGFDIYNNGLILSNALYGEDRNYCRADQYQELAALMESEFNPTGYCYTYSVLDIEDTEWYIDHNYLLTEEQEAAVNNILATVEGIQRMENAEYHYDYYVALHACSDNMLLQEHAVSIEKNNDTYYIVDYMNSDNENGIEYVVPSEYNTIFDGIIKQEVDAKEKEEAYYRDLYGYDEEDFGYEIDYDVM